jgi:hypothetical protein
MNSRGYTLIEICISLLISAVMVGAVFSMALTVKTGNIKSDHKVIAASAERELSTQLSAFVSTYWDYCTSNWAAGGSSEIRGPASNAGAGTNSWVWANTPSPWGGTVADSVSAPASCPGLYALCAGAGGAAQTHTLTNYLPPWFEAAPYSARASYTVTATPPAPGCPNTGRLTSPQVGVSVTWNEP